MEFVIIIFFNLFVFTQCVCICLGVLEPEELFQTLNFRPSRPSEQDRTSSVFQDNTRRSLAWDNAFLTSSGMILN